jgi:hypothetical protein
VSVVLDLDDVLSHAGPRDSHRFRANRGGFSIVVVASLVGRYEVSSVMK